MPMSAVVSRINVYAQLAGAEVLRHSVGTGVGQRCPADGGRVRRRPSSGRPLSPRRSVRRRRRPAVEDRQSHVPACGLQDRAETVRAGSTCPAPMRLLRPCGRSGSCRRGGGPSAADIGVRACARTAPPASRRRSWRRAPHPAVAIRRGHERAGRLGLRAPTGRESGAGAPRRAAERCYASQSSGRTVSATRPRLLSSSM